MSGSGAPAIEYDPRLIEETVLRALRGHAEAAPFRRQRDRLYEIPDVEARDAAFREFHAAWFERLGLGEAIDQALTEQPSIPGAVRACLVAFAASDRQEGAELFVLPREETVSEADRRSLVIRVKPDTLLRTASLRTWLRHELLHIADMLDPRFGYEPWLPSSDVGPAHARLLIDRYRVAWDAYIDGRLTRLGWAPAGARADRLDEWRRAFPMLGDLAAGVFERFFGAASLRHEELVAFAVAPDAWLARAPRGSQPGGRCPLCRFPTHAFEPDPHRLPAAALRAIRGDFPAWEPDQGLCLQCADLYRARVASPWPTAVPRAG